METNVIFRKFKGEIIAIFPNEPTTKYFVLSYQHIGQHSACDYQYVIRNSKPATFDEYESLMNELKTIGYSLNIVKRKPKR